AVAQINAGRADIDLTGTFDHRARVAMRLAAEAARAGLAFARTGRASIALAAVVSTAASGSDSVAHRLASFLLMHPSRLSFLVAGSDAPAMPIRALPLPYRRTAWGRFIIHAFRAQQSAGQTRQFRGSGALQNIDPHSSPA